MDKSIGRIQLCIDHSQNGKPHRTVTATHQFADDRAIAGEVHQVTASGPQVVDRQLRKAVAVAVDVQRLHHQQTPADQ